MKILICEDDRAELAYLEEMTDKWAKRSGASIQMDSFVSAEQFIYSHEGVFSYEVCLLDIQMSGMNGMKLAKWIRERDGKAVILFITGVPDYAIEGYEVGALRYLLKPIRKEELYRVLDRVKEELAAEEDDFFLLDVAEGIRKIAWRDIYYLEADLHYLNMKCAGEIVRWKANFGKNQPLFEAHGFVMIRRGLLVNMRYVERIGKDYCVLDGGEELPLSRSRYKQVNQAFIEYYRENINDRKTS